MNNLNIFFGENEYSSYIIYSYHFERLIFYGADNLLVGGERQYSKLWEVFQDVFLCVSSLNLLYNSVVRENIKIVCLRLGDLICLLVLFCGP